MPGYNNCCVTITVSYTEEVPEKKPVHFLVFSFISTILSSHVQYTEEEFIVALKNHETPAFHLLYDLYAGALYGYLSKNYLTGKRQKENILKDLFIVVWKDIGQYDSSKCRLFTWVFIQLKVITNLHLEMKTLKVAKKLSLNCLPEFSG